MPLKRPDRHAQVGQTGFLTPDWMGFPSLSQNPFYNPPPKWFLHSDPPSLYLFSSQFWSVETPKHYPAGDTEYFRVCSSLQTSSSFFWRFPDSHGPRFKNSSGPGWAFRPSQPPQEPAHTYLQAIIMQVNPVLFCLSLLQELIGLNTSLPSLFGLRPGESDLEDLGIIQNSPKPLEKTHLHYWCGVSVPN